MIRISLLAVFVAAAITSAPVSAQTSSVEPGAQPSNPSAGRLLNQDHLTSTGATVQRPRISQDSAPTLMGRTIHDENDGAEHSICGDC
jgi:hypothetical protein